jgi:TolB-like protein/tetratricopeptide (TPR) repeat protein
MSAFLKQLRQRKITQWTLAYLAGAWVFLEVLGFVADHFDWPAVIVQGATITLGMGVSLVLVLAWFHGEKGRQRLGLLEGLLLGGLSLITVALLFQLPPAGSTGEINPASSGAETGRSLAVLPFLNATDDPEQQYFSDGITEELINELARLPGLRVAARTSSFQFAGSREGLDLADVARQLGVAALLEGSVRRAGDAVRVTATLINAEDGFQMWSESFDRKMTDIFAIQDEIASAIATALHVQLVLDGSIEPSVPRTASIDAYNLYLLGRYHFEKRTIFELQQAQRYFEDAIERDPLYAPAYNGLVDATMLQSAGGFGDIPVEQNIAFALPLINRSLKLDPNLAETHASLGLLRMMERDLRASEAALLRAIELNPNLSRAHNWLYITYEQMSQQRKAFESLQRAFTLDPLSPIVNSNMAAEWWIRGNNSEALQAAQRVIQIAPDGPLGYRRYARIKRTSGELAEAVDWYRKSLEVTPGELNSELELGSLLVDMGYFEEAERLLGERAYIAYLAQNRIEEALSAVHAVLDGHPEDFRSVAAAARAELRAGNFDQARLLLEPLAEGHDSGTGPLFRPSGIHFWDPQIAAIDLAVAMLEEGDKEAGLELLSEVKKYFDAKKAEGLDYAMLNYQQARIFALEGNHEEALRVLRNVIAAGWRFWYLANDPALKSMWDNPEFSSIVADKDMLVEQERVRLASQ